MAALEADLVAPLILRVAGEPSLSPAEQAEAIRMAQGLGCKDSATSAGVAPKTVRARRKRIYRKLQISGHHDFIATLLGISLGMLRAQPQPLPAPPQGTP